MCIIKKYILLGIVWIYSMLTCSRQAYYMYIFSGPLWGIIFSKNSEKISEKINQVHVQQFKMLAVCPS